ncbi:metal ABC transporter substrate-binding protein [Marinobacter sp. NSM]|uniref:metal ABC transporter substrate-binding protein n=1 Tax=Marinobacter sp. NSM TaxID=3458004 RepID=UPI004035279A
MISKPNRLAWAFGWLLAFASMPTSANLNVFACEPEWASLVSALLPDANITTATTAWQDPHYIEARPSLIAAMSKADLAVCTGASLEAGWLPSLISRAANRKIQPGSDGLFFAADHAPLHQSHDHVDRSMGDVHPEGDPHLHLSPDAIPRVVDALAKRLASLAPNQATAIQRRYIRWRGDWNQERQQWRVAAQRLEGTEVVTQHSTFDYLLRWLNVNVAADLEPKPGLPPSSRHLRDVLATPSISDASVILVASYQDDRPATWLSNQSGIPKVVLPGTVTGEPGQQTLQEVIGLIIEALLAHHRVEHVD